MTLNEMLAMINIFGLKYCISYIPEYLVVKYFSEGMYCILVLFPFNFLLFCTFSCAILFKSNNVRIEYRTLGGSGVLKLPERYGNVSSAFCSSLWPLSPMLTSCCEGPILEWPCRWRWPAGCCCGGGSIYPRWISAALCLPRWHCSRSREANWSTHIHTHTLINGCIFTEEL